MKKIPVLILSSVSLLSLTGCASISGGLSQPVAISTPKKQGIHCILENSKGKWEINSTPGIATVRRAYGNLEISCIRKGYPRMTASIPSSTRPIVFGNILLGGIIGAAVDIANGAAYEYPQEIVVE